MCVCVCVINLCNLLSTDVTHELVYDIRTKHAVLRGNRKTSLQFSRNEDRSYIDSTNHVVLLTNRNRSRDLIMQRGIWRLLGERSRYSAQYVVRSQQKQVIS